MRGFATYVRLLLVTACIFMAWGCKSDTRQDVMITSVANASRTYRATIIQRQYFVDGKLDTSPTTYVLLDPDAGAPTYENGEDFMPSQIVMQPAQCGPLSLKWEDENNLKITCEKCGLAQSALGPHVRTAGSVRIAYEGFPEMSSWETASRTN